MYVTKTRYNTDALSYTFYTSSERLSNDFATLVRSLGIVDTINVRNTHYVKNGERVESDNLCYTHHLRVPNGLEIFASEKHKNQYRKKQLDEPRRKIVGVEFVRKDQCQCIMVESECHQYITDNMTLTHNTTLAKVLTNTLGYETLFINASLETGIDTVRNKIQDFCSSISLTGSMKCVVLDEADGLAFTSQQALRAFIEKFAATTRFIFTCNYVSKLIPALHSRCTVISYDFTNEERNALMKDSAKKLFHILKIENVEFDPKTVVQILQRHYPDLRRCLNELQRFSSNGSITSEAVMALGHDNFTALIQSLKTKNFKDMRQWVGTNTDIGSEKIFGYFYQNAQNFMAPESIPQLVLTSAEYQYKAAFVADQEINLAAYFTELMSQCKFL